MPLDAVVSSANSLTCAQPNDLREVVAVGSTDVKLDKDYLNILKILYEGLSQLGINVCSNVYVWEGEIPRTFAYGLLHAQCDQSDGTAKWKATVTLKSQDIVLKWDARELTMKRGAQSFFCSRSIDLITRNKNSGFLTHLSHLRQTIFCGWLETIPDKDHNQTELGQSFFHGANFHGLGQRFFRDYPGLFQKRSMHDATFKDNVIHSLNFDNLILNRAQFINCSLTDCSISNCQLLDVTLYAFDFNNVTINNCTFDAVLEGVTFHNLTSKSPIILREGKAISADQSAKKQGITLSFSDIADMRLVWSDSSRVIKIEYCDLGKVEFEEPLGCSIELLCCTLHEKLDLSKCTVVYDKWSPANKLFCLNTMLPSLSASIRLREWSSCLSGTENTLDTIKTCYAKEYAGNQPQLLQKQTTDLKRDWLAEVITKLATITLNQNEFYVFLDYFDRRFTEELYTEKYRDLPQKITKFIHNYITKWSQEPGFQGKILNYENQWLLSFIERALYPRFLDHRVLNITTPFMVSFYSHYVGQIRGELRSQLEQVKNQSTLDFFQGCSGGHLRQVWWFPLMPSFKKMTSLDSKFKAFADAMVSEVKAKNGFWEPGFLLQGQRWKNLNFENPWWIDAVLTCYEMTTDSFDALKGCAGNLGYICLLARLTQFSEKTPFLIKERAQQIYQHYLESPVFDSLWRSEEFTDNFSGTTAQPDWTSSDNWIWLIVGDDAKTVMLLSFNSLSKMLSCAPEYHWDQHFLFDLAEGANYLSPNYAILFNQMFSGLFPLFCSLAELPKRFYKDFYKVLGLDPLSELNAKFIVALDGALRNESEIVSNFNNQRSLTLEEQTGLNDVFGKVLEDQRAHDQPRTLSADHITQLERLFGEYRVTQQDSNRLAQAFTCLALSLCQLCSPGYFGTELDSPWMIREYIAALLKRTHTLESSLLGTQYSDYMGRLLGGTDENGQLYFTCIAILRDMLKNQLKKWESFDRALYAELTPVAWR